MPVPNVSFSLRFRVEVDHQPGNLGRLTTAIGDAGGNILGVEMVSVNEGRITRDITVLAIDAPHAARIREAIVAIPGIALQAVLDRTFQMHEHGKIEVRSKAPLESRDDLSMAYTPGVARVCQAIHADPHEGYRYTMKANTVAVVVPVCRK